MEQDYYGNKPRSFGSQSRVFKHNPRISKAKVNELLHRNEIFTRFKQQPIYVYNKRELFQADVVFFTDSDMVDVNEGYKYLFTCIDCFSKMAWVFPLKK